MTLSTNEKLNKCLTNEFDRFLTCSFEIYKVIGITYLEGSKLSY
jgi:hypothetical protein